MIKNHGRAMDATELANYLKVSRVSLLRRARRGTIPSFRIGTSVRFDPNAIYLWLLERGIKSLSTQR
jgi:excisionase family DNA binding protein